MSSAKSLINFGTGNSIAMHERNSNGNGPKTEPWRTPVVSQPIVSRKPKLLSFIKVTFEPLVNNASNYIVV